MNRRNLLKGIAGAAATGTALSTSAAGRPIDVGRASHVHLQSQYEALSPIQNAFETHAGSLIEQLDASDVLSSADLSELDAFRNVGDVSDADHVDVTSTVDHRTEIETAVVRITETTDDADVSLFVLPEAGRSYATVDPVDGEKRLVAPHDHDDVSTQGDFHQQHGDWEFLRTENTCTGDNCNGGMNDCYSGSLLLTCAWDYYTEETHEVYECGRIDLLPDGSTEECSVTKKELVNTNCSDNCCNHEGPGCGYCGEC